MAVREVKRRAARASKTQEPTPSQDADSALVTSQITNPELVRKRRDQLVGAAIRQFSKRGFHETTVKDIAADAGVSPGLIYQYVRDKEDVLFLALQHVVRTNRYIIPKATEGVTDPILRFMAATDAYFRVIDANRQAVMLTYRETKSLTPLYVEAIKAMEVETNALISATIKGCIDRKLFHPVDIELVTYNVVMMAHAWALKHWRLGSLYSIDSYIRGFVQSILDWLLTPSGRKHYESVQAVFWADTVAAAKAERLAAVGAALPPDTAVQKRVRRRAR